MSSSGATTLELKLQQRQVGSVVPFVVPSLCALSVCLPTGKAKSFDHCALVHAMWKRLAELRTGVWVERVPTELNIADDPSRCAHAAGVRAIALCIVLVRQGRLPTAWNDAQASSAQGCTFGQHLLVASDVGERFFASSKS